MLFIRKFKIWERHKIKMEKEENQETIAKDLLSKDSTRVWSASGNILHHCQDHEYITFFIPYLSEIKEQTKNLSMGGMLASNQRILDFAIRTIEFHENFNQCPCQLYQDSGEDCFFDPKKQEAKGYVKIMETHTYEKSDYVDHYLVECTRCHRRFRVKEGMYHYMWWGWMDVDIY